MRISERAIELPRLVLLASAIACLIGLFAAFTLPKERQPRAKLPVIVAAVPNPGAAPATNEAQIIRKVEDNIGILDGLRDTGSVISEAVSGAAVFQFIFDHHVDVTEAKRDVESLFNRVKGEFPPDAQTDPGPLITDVAFEDWPIIQVFVAGGYDGHQRRRIAERLQTQIETVPGVSQVDLFGGLEQEVQIEVNPHVMTLYGFSYNDIANAVSRANLEAPSGEVETPQGAVARARTQGRLQSVDDIRRVPIGVRDGKVIVLEDLANVYMGHVQRTSIARYNQEDAVVLLARAKTDIDVMSAAEQVQAIVDQFIASGAAEQTHIGTVRSQAREIRYMITELGTSAIYGTALVIAILWVAMGWRNALIISIVLPFALLTTAAFMWLSKQTINPDIAINNMTLFALILVVGIVVDGGIIAGENIFRHRELGRSPIEAAKRGIHEVGGALICAYLTTFSAFAPMFVVRGVMGDFLELMPIVVMYALAAAMLVDHFLLPVVSLYLMKVPRQRLIAARQELRDQGAEHLSPEALEIASAEAIVAQSRIKQVYGGMLGYALRHRLLVLFLAVTVALSPVALFMSGAIGFEFFPDSDIPIIEVDFELPLGSSMERRTVEVAKAVEDAVLRAVREDEWYRPSPTMDRARPVTTMGQPGALSIRLDNDTGAGPEFGMVYVELELAGDRERSAAEIRQAITDALPVIPGVQMRVSSPSEGPPAGAPILVRVLGHRDTSLEVLQRRAAEVERMLTQIPGTYDIKNDFRMRPEIVVTPNRATASLFNIDAAQITMSVNYALDGVRVGEVDFGADDEIDLRIRNMETHRQTHDDVANLPLRSPSGHIVSLDQVATIERLQNPNSIRHYDLRRVVNIRAELRDGYLVDDVRRQLTRMLNESASGVAVADAALAVSDDVAQRVIASDDEVMIEFGGENEIRDDALEDLNIALIIAFGLMLIILVVQFNSFILPLIILFSVPLSLVGVMIGLMICGFHFSISSMIGVVALSGIVVNDAIVLVDFIDRMRRTGVPMDKAVVYAGQLRLRPIFLTTVTTCGGLLPLALNLSGGGEFWQPLTVTMMFGLSFATLLQLFVVPIACYTFINNDKKSWFDPLERRELSEAPVV